MKFIHFLAIALFATAFSHNSANAQSASSDRLKTAVVKVVNLHCNNDMPTIKKRLLNQDGIDEVSFTDRIAEASTFTIKYHSSATSQPAIEQAIETTPGCDDQIETPYRVKKEKAVKKKRSSGASFLRLVCC